MHSYGTTHLAVNNSFKCFVTKAQLDLLPGLHAVDSLQIQSSKVAASNYGRTFLYRWQPRVCYYCGGTSAEFFCVPKLEWSAGNGELSRDMDEFSMLLPLLAVLFRLDMDNDVAGIGSPPVVSQSAPLL